MDIPGEEDEAEDDEAVAVGVIVCFMAIDTGEGKGGGWWGMEAQR